MSHGVRGVLMAWLLMIGSGLAVPELGGIHSACAQGTRSTEVYRRLKAEVNQIPLIDTHDHLWPFDQLPALRQTREGRGVNLAGLWQNSYLPAYNPITPWNDNMDFLEWWRKAKHDFDNVRALSFYQYQLQIGRAHV